MNRNLAQYIISRIVHDYIQLRSKGLTPSVDQYASLWPDDPSELTAALIYEEYRFRWRAGEKSRVDVFLREYPDSAQNRDLLLRLLEHELQSFPEDPDPAELRGRFPKLTEMEIDRLVEQSVRRRLWNHETVTGTIRREDDRENKPSDDSSDSFANGHLPPWLRDSSQEESPPKGSGNWGRSRTPSLRLDSDRIASLVHDTTKDGLSIDTDWPPKAAPPGRLLSEHEEFEVRDTVSVEKHIGSGAWKDVYKARQKSTLQLVAFKHLREKNDSELEALIREVRTQAQLTHQNIPPVFALDILGNGEAIVIEKLVNGHRWSDSMSQRTLDDNLRILLEIGQATAYAHRRHQLIHRDLKPDNVVVNDAFDEVYLIDWGLAVSVAPEPPDDNTAHISQVRGIAGTALYWAPEMARGDTSKISTASDVFLLGGLLYEILTRHPPYEVFSEHTNRIARTTVRFSEVGPMLRAVRGAVFPPKVRAPDRFIPDELALIAMKAMAPEPEGRYRDAGDFVDAVKRYQHHAEATLRGDAAWKSLQHVEKEIESAGETVRKLHPLTLRLIELADVFHQVSLALTEDEGISISGIYEGADDPLEPALHGAQQGELESRTKLFDLTLRTGDLTLATAQIDLMQRNPFCREEIIRDRRSRLGRHLAARRRARTMKWVAVFLLVAFLGSSMLYGLLINRQYRATERQRRIAEEQRQLAEENLDKARSAVNRFYTMFAKDDAVRNTGLMQLQRGLFEEARKYREEFVAQKSDDPEILFDQMQALFDIARIETDFGNLSDAAAYYRRAINEGGRLVDKQPDNPKFLDLLAKCYKDIGIVFERLELENERILDVNRRALSISRTLAERFPDDMEYQRNLARILHNLGILLTPVTGKQTRAEQYYRESLAVWERLRTVDEPTYLDGKARTLLALGTLYLEKAVTALNNIERYRESTSATETEEHGPRILQELEIQRKNVTAASEELSTARELIEKLKEAHPGDYGIDEEFLHGVICLEQGKTCYAGQFETESRKNLGDAVNVLRILVRKAPEHLIYLDRLDEACTLLYEILFEEGNVGEQLELCRWRRKEVEELMSRHPENHYHRYFWCNWSLKLAESLVLDTRIDEASALLKDAIARMEAPSDCEADPETEQLLQLLRNQLRIIVPDKN